MISDILIGLVLLVVAVFALVFFCAVAVASILVSFVSENILPLSAMAAACLLVRYFGL